jgi:hypothetical protein
MAPQLHPKPRPPLPLLLPPPLPLQRAPHGVSHEAPTPVMAALLWRASHKLIFLCGMTKIDAYNLPLVISSLDFVGSEL